MRLDRQPPQVRTFASDAESGHAVSLSENATQVGV